MTSPFLGTIVGLLVCVACAPAARQSHRSARAASSSQPDTQPATLDFREPMALAAPATAHRLDPAQEYRALFMVRGHGGVPVTPEHASWDLADMTGRYLEGLILARH